MRYDEGLRDIDIVVSTRVRLARNLRGYPFPHKCSLMQKQEICEKVKKALLSGNSVISEQFSLVPMEDYTEIQKVSLVEKHLVSPEFIANPQGKMLILSKDESMSVLVNEEDHLRIQVIKTGNSLNAAYESAERIEKLLSEHLNFAYDEEYGYLTQCLTNLGTAMRVSMMLHLPALTVSGNMPKIKSDIERLSVTIRGTYGEGTGVYGDMYQISNQITLGLSEKMAIENLNLLAEQVMNEERRRRAELESDIVIQDKIERSLGLLKTARILPPEEFMRLISYVKLGISLGLLKGKEVNEINELISLVQPATLVCAEAKSYTEQERDIKRAEIVKTALEDVESDK